MRFGGVFHFVLFNDFLCAIVSIAHKWRTKSRFEMTSTILAHAKGDYNKTTLISRFLKLP